MNLSIGQKSFCIKKEHLAILISALLIIGILIMYAINKNTNTFVISSNSDNLDLISNSETIKNKTNNESLLKNKNNSSNIANAEKSPDTPNNEKDSITIDIKGAIKNPGIYNIQKDSIINDVINLAGGFTEDADVDNINLAFRISDNVCIIVKSKINNNNNNNNKQNTNNGSSSNISQNNDARYSNVQNSSSCSGVGVEFISGASCIMTSGNASINNSNNSKININTATKEELDKLPNIGPSLADSIIKYRQSKGNFKRIEDIMNIGGIKKNKFEKIKDLITV